MATTACLTPSPPISSSPGSLSSATSNSDSAPNPQSPPARSTTYFDLAPPPASSNEFASSPASSATKRRNRRSTPLILDESSVYDDHDPAGTSRDVPSRGGLSGTTDKESKRRRPSIRTRTLSLSFSPREQAFTPTAMRPSQGTVAAASFPFPSPARTTPGSAAVTGTTNNGRSSPTHSTSSSRVPLDRSPSSASTATTATRRPRPVRSSMSRIDVPSRSNSLRPPAPASVPMSNRASTSSAEGGDAREQLEAKVVILGSQGVGKTSIIARCTTGQFRTSPVSTVGASLLTKKITIDSTQVRFQIWDPAGQERFRSMAPLYYRGALAAILVYDVTDESSFEDIKIWLEGENTSMVIRNRSLMTHRHLPRHIELRKNMTDELIILVVGAKADLSSTLRTIAPDAAQRQVALWLRKLDDPDDVSPSTTAAGTPSVVASGLTTPFPAVESTIPVQHQPSPRGSSPSSPNRSRANTLRSPAPTKSSIGTIPPGRPATPSAALDRVRKMSSQLSQPSHVASSGTSGARGESGLNSSSTQLHHSHRPKHPGLTASMTMPDLGSLSAPSASSSTFTMPPPPPPHSPSFQTLPQSNQLNHHHHHSHYNHASTLPPPTSSSSLTMMTSSSSTSSSSELGMVRSTSNKIGLSLSSLGMSAAARRLSHDERMKKTWEDAVFERERARRDREEQEEKRISRLVRECPVRVVEVSAKDGSGEPRKFS